MMMYRSDVRTIKRYIKELDGEVYDLNPELMNLSAPQRSGSKAISSSLRGDDAAAIDF